MIDLIVPTIIGREASLERCVESFRKHTDEINPIIVSDSKNCGWGWRQGIAASRADYLLLACDDLECASDTWAEACVEAVSEGFLPCPRVWTPAGAVESQGGDMRTYAHLIARYRKHRSPCDFTTVPFMSREQAEAIGSLDVHYASDVWISYRGRQLGYETTLCHGYDLIHHQELVGRGAGMEQSQRDAMDWETVQVALEKEKTTV